MQKLPPEFWQHLKPIPSTFVWRERLFLFPGVALFIYFFKKGTITCRQCAGCKILRMAPFVTGYTFLESYLKLIKFTYCCGLKQQCPDSSSTWHLTNLHNLLSQHHAVKLPYLPKHHGHIQTACGNEPGPALTPEPCWELPGWVLESHCETMTMPKTT